jgi:hypothetical protein
VTAVIGRGDEAAAGELTLTQLGEQAAEAVRALGHLTRPGTGGLSEPAELCALVAELAALAGRLPQLLGQLLRWLADEQAADRLRVDPGSGDVDPAAAVAAAISELARAREHARDAGGALDAAQQILAHLGAAGDPSARRDRR